MRVLVLSGEVTHTRPMSYGFPPKWHVNVLTIVDQEFLTLCEKYEDPHRVSLPETISFLRRALQLVVTDVQSHDYDVIVGVGYGAHVLANMVTAYEWRGPSIFVFSEGTTRLYFTTPPPLDEVEFDTRPIRSAHVTIGDKAKLYRGRGRRDRYEFDRGTVLQVHVFDHDWERALYMTGMLSSLVSTVSLDHS
jgi:hypothetical protein